MRDTIPILFASGMLPPMMPAWHSRHSFLYDGTRWTTLDFPGASYRVVFGIDGSNLVAYYQDSTGYHGFLYVIPEPATLFLLGFGILMLKTRKNSK